MTALPSHRRAVPTEPSQSPERKDAAATATIAASAAASEPRSVVDAWRRKLRLHGERPDSTQPAPEAPRRKRPSFIKTLFKPEHRPAPSPAARPLPPPPKSTNQTSSDLRPLRVLPATPPSASRWQDQHGVATVGGRRVPFTLDAHRRLRKKRALASVAEAQPTQSSAEAYRRRAYYPAQSARHSSKKEKAAKKP